MMMWLGLLSGLASVFVACDRSTPPSIQVAQSQPAPEAILPSLTKEPIDDPREDGWDSEVFNDLVNKQLNRIKKYLGGEAQSIVGLAATDFSCDALLPNKLETVYENKTLRVIRGVERDEYAGADTLAHALDQLRSKHDAGSDLHVSFKVFHVKLAEQQVTTRQYVSIWQNQIETHMTWLCTWENAAPLTMPKLKSIHVEKYEQAHGEAIFVDSTNAVIGHTAVYQTQLAYSSDYWWRRIQTIYGIDMDGHQGIAVGDVDGDGLEDVYLCQSGGMPNRLLRHELDGSVTDISKQAGVDWMERTSSALLIDIDNDGDQDLVVASDPEVLFMENDGTGRFKSRAACAAGSLTFSMAAADYDRDGDLDLYICIRGSNRPNTSSQVPMPIPYHNANNGGTNILLRNDGNWNFTDVTKAMGLNANNQRWSFAAAWEDYDNDGDMDLYVANDFGLNNLYRNDGDGFVDIAVQSGAADQASGMSVSWGDYNRDGLMDCYISNMFSSAGSRTTYQNRYQPGAGEDVMSQIQRMARGNSLFQNRGGQSFVDVSELAGVTMGRWAWASKFIDINNDGWEDIVVVNGNMTRDSGTKDL